MFAVGLGAVQVAREVLGPVPRPLHALAVRGAQRAACRGVRHGDLEMGNVVLVTGVH